MSLFDVIRYSNTNLSSRAELEDLPEGLLELYWEELGWPTLGFPTFTASNRNTLFRWTIDYVNEDNKDSLKEAFKKALIRYGASDDK